MRLFPAQNLVFPENMLVAVKRYVRSAEMLACLPGHICLTDAPKSMIQFIPTRFVSTLYGTATGRDFTVLRWDPFHIGSDGQEIVPPVVLNLGPTVRNATRRVNGRSDLAWMNGVGEYCGAYEDWAHAVRIHTSGWPGLKGRRELGVRA